jgi:hypothetical protein
MDNGSRVELEKVRRCEELHDLGERNKADKKGT